MARQTGATAQLAVAFETTYGTAPASGYRLMPFASTTLGAAQPLLASELVGQGRDPLAPVLDAVTVDGDLVLPMDVENLGVWLKAAFGAPTTTGTTPKVHTFQSGGAVLPSLAMEVGMPSVPSFAMYSGVMLDELSFNMARSGLLTATAKLIGQGEAMAAASAAGSTTALALRRFGHFHGSIKRNGASLGNIVSAQVTYRNNLDPVGTIRADGKIDGIEAGNAELTGQITARFADTTLLDQAVAGSACELVFGHELAADAKWSLTAHAVYLPRPRRPIQGPQGVEVTFDWQAAKATTPARMCTAVLTNTIASY
ncbi:phage tail tube protein [Rubellimicrobium aerolatum]|uniref:Phage tail tube protein n=1 Tax=Rubellimicrobium aerolatum TaxID=490979 RepID=A0ABW0SF13_9RHOB|nr:phage tail tube protein [Rubellimicrobium aerolatum]MBP1806462.1 hypothetical protein [Rubellimicrobium aerolatum]